MKLGLSFVEIHRYGASHMLHHQLPWPRVYSNDDCYMAEVFKRIW